MNPQSSLVERAHPILGGVLSVRNLFSMARTLKPYTEICEVPERQLLGARILMDERRGSGGWDLLQIGESIYVIITNVLYREPPANQAVGDGHLCFHVRLSGEVTTLAGPAPALRIRGPSLTLWHQPEGLQSCEHELAGQRVLSVTLFCDPSFLTAKSLSRAGKAQYLERFLACTGQGINYSNLPVTSEIVNTVLEMVNSRFTSGLRLIHFEAKALELFCFITEALDRLADLSNGPYSESDLRRLHRAREILATRFAPLPNTSALAREVGINETKLKRGFKALFGHTVYKFGHNCRMQNALTLLRDQHIPVSLVAERSGFRHQTSFAAAFKSHFGYRPRDVLRAPPKTEASSPCPPLSR